MKITLTASSMACALRCPRRYWYDNILGLKEVTPSEALRIGTAVHNGGEARAKGLDFEAQYAAAITGGTLDEWMAAKVFGILGAYDRAYGETEDRDYSAMEPEVEFTDPIDGSRTFEQRGKADGLAVLRDGTPKLTADSSKGERVKGHAETTDEYGTRILEAMTAEKDKYFARRDVEVTLDMLAEFRRERLGVCRMLLHFAAEARKSERPEYAYPRACNPDNCRSCPFAGFCLNRIHVDAGHVPEGFKIALHEELGTNATT